MTIAPGDKDKKLDMNAVIAKYEAITLNELIRAMLYHGYIPTYIANVLEKLNFPISFQRVINVRKYMEKLENADNILTEEGLMAVLYYRMSKSTMIISADAMAGMIKDIAKLKAKVKKLKSKK